LSGRSAAAQDRWWVRPDVVSAGVVSADEGASVGDTSAGVGIGDEDEDAGEPVSELVGELAGAGAGAGVGEFDGGTTGQVDASVLVLYGRADVVGLAVSGEGTSAAGVVPGTSVPAPVGLGVAVGAAAVGVALGPVLGVAPGVVLGRTGSVFATHDAGFGAEVCDPPEAVAVLPWLACPAPGVAPSADGVPPTPLARVPLPSVPASLRGGPLPPFSAVLAWRIAWRTG
jgi:hypothetical protein